MPSHAESIREYARKAYIEPARRRGDTTVRIVAGDIQRELKLINRTPAVCQALGSRIFLDQNHLTLDGREGPPSGVSTTVVFTYRLNGNTPKADPLAGLRSLIGSGREAFAKFGGGEKFLLESRKTFHGDERDGR